ncbi:MAG: MarR family transcriptional regulator [Ponticaulis sp.]|nr:MarR family transcriptional regulator [Ponticaulis sp.]
MARKQSHQLTEAERRIMDVLWDSGEASVQDVTDALTQDHQLAYTTVLTTIRIMAEKGYVGFRKEGRAHIYHPLLSQDAARKTALGDVMKAFFQGSSQRLAQHLVENENLTLEDIERLRAEVIRRSESGE